MESKQKIANPLLQKTNLEHPHSFQLTITLFSMLIFYGQHYERFLGPELFFHPEFNGGKWRSPIDEVIDKAIQGSPIEYRNRFYNNIVLSGGSTLFEGFPERLQNQVQNRIDHRLLNHQLKSGVQPKPIPVIVQQNPFQIIAAWQGGSLMGLNPKFNEVYHTREQYMEIGAQIARHNATFEPKI